jgi:hypothetical protein
MLPNNVFLQVESDLVMLLYKIRDQAESTFALGKWAVE